MLRPCAMLGVLACYVIAATMAAGSAPKEPIVLARWSGKNSDESLRARAPKDGYVGDPTTWTALWKAWRPDEKTPQIDFRKNLVLVGTVPGPNQVIIRPRLSEKGDLQVQVAGTKIGGPGFGYVLVQIRSDGIKTINGRPVEPAETMESIIVTVTGTLRTGIVAIGGETTGTIITAKGITWELDLGVNPDLQQAAEKLDKKLAVVHGSLERRAGVEIKERWIVTIESIQGVD